MHILICDPDKAIMEGPKNMYIYTCACVHMYTCTHIHMCWEAAGDRSAGRLPGSAGGVLGGCQGVLGGYRGVPGGYRGVLGGCRGVLGGCWGVLGGCWGVLGGCRGVHIISQAGHGAQRVTIIGRTRLPST